MLQINLTLTHPGLAESVLSSEQNLCSKSVLINLRFNLALVGLGLVTLQGLMPIRKEVFLVPEGVPRCFPKQDWFCEQQELQEGNNTVAEEQEN